MTAAPGREPDVVVSIVNHCNRDVLLACLEPLVGKLPNSVRSEVVVLDNASGDGSVESIRETYPGVRVIAQAHRAGFGANHNRVIRSTSSRYVLLLNDDVAMDGREVPRLVRYLDAHPAVGAVAPKVLLGDGTVQHTLWRFPRPTVCLRIALTLGARGGQYAVEGAPRHIECASAAALLVRRSAVEEIGAFDEAFFMYSEDTDLCRRLADGGYQVHVLPKVVVTHHKEHGATAAVSDLLIRESVRSLRLYWRKHHGKLSAPVAAWLRGCAFALSWGATSGIRLLPRRLRPTMADRWSPRVFRLAARGCWRGVEGPGLRELAEEWNRVHARDGVRASE